MRRLFGRTTAKPCRRRRLERRRARAQDFISLNRRKKCALGASQVSVDASIRQKRPQYSKEGLTRRPSPLPATTADRGAACNVGRADFALGVASTGLRCRPDDSFQVRVKLIGRMRRRLLGTLVIRATGQGRVVIECEVSAARPPGSIPLVRRYRASCRSGFGTIRKWMSIPIASANRSGSPSVHYVRNDLFPNVRRHSPTAPTPKSPLPVFSRDPCGSGRPHRLDFG